MLGIHATMLLPRDWGEIQPDLTGAPAALGIQAIPLEAKAGFKRLCFNRMVRSRLAGRLA
jgi:hypothetical protein